MHKMVLYWPTVQVYGINAGKINIFYLGLYTVQYWYRLYRTLVN